MFYFQFSSLILAGSLAFAGYKIGQRESVPSSLPTLTLFVTSLLTPAIDSTANWKTYRNEEYGFEIKYPSEFTFFSEGPNFVQQTIDKGEQISGTAQPSYNTIIFSDDYNELGGISIFHKYEKELLEENYKDKGYLYLFGPCDIRWEFKPEFFSLDFVNNINILTVKGKNQESVSQNCHYLKNLDRNLIVISNKEYKSNIFNLMLSTFKFLPSMGSTSSP